MFLKSIISQRLVGFTRQKKERKNHAACASYLRFDPRYQRQGNRPFPSSKRSHFQNEAKCETFVVKMSFISMTIKNHFYINGFALNLALKVRLLELGNGLLKTKRSITFGDFWLTTSSCWL